MRGVWGVGPQALPWGEGRGAGGGLVMPATTWYEGGRAEERQEGAGQIKWPGWGHGRAGLVGTGQEGAGRGGRPGRLAPGKCRGFGGFRALGVSLF